MNPAAETNFRFADFELDATKRLLLKDGNAVALNSKTFDLLEALIERRGEIVEKDELLERIWEGQFVEESNLTVQISTLRKLLGESRGENRFIVTVPGKGYKFVCEAADESHEVIVENHRISRILVDETIDAREGQQVKGRIFSVGRLVLFVPFTFLLIFGGYYFFHVRRNSGTLPFTRTQIRQLTNNGKVQIAVLSADAKLFAYVTDDFGQQALWFGQTNGDGNNIQLRPPADANYASLAFSPDGGNLYFSMRDDANPEYALFRIPSLGGATEKLIDGMFRFALAPDGKSIGFARHNKIEKTDELFITNVDSRETRKVAAADRANSIVSSSLSFSPDGQTLAYGATTGELTGELFNVQISNGEIRQITSQDFGSIDKTAWLADGSGLILSAIENGKWSGVQQYKIWHVTISDGMTVRINSDLSSYADGLGVSKDYLLTVEHRQLNNVWVAPANDLKQAKQITFGSFGKYEGLWGLDWTPDGRIVFDSSDAQSQAISVMNADGSAKRQLTASGKVDSCLSVSNDGRYVVFHSTRGGGFDIWRLEIENGDLRQLTFGKQNYHPAISFDSRFVFYKSLGDGVGELRRVSIDGGESVALTDKETGWMSVSPDGKFIAATYKTDKSRLAILPAEGGEPAKQFDVPKTALFFVGIRWTPDGKAVVYRDSAYGYWRQGVDGGPPVRLENLPKEYLYNFAWSKDGKQFAYVRGEEISDVVLFRNQN